MDIVFHYPPELFSLLVDTIPLMNRSKMDVLLFFKGSGVAERYLKDLTDRVEADRQSITKYEIVRTVLTSLNEAGEPALAERREVLKRVSEFEDFSTCWPDDQLKARGLVAQIGRLINVKDSFTKMRIEKERESRRHTLAKQRQLRESNRKKEELEAIRSDLFRLFGDVEPHERGHLLESVINRLFKHFGVLVRESFTLTGDKGEGVIEQIDGVIEFEGSLYLCEVKWLRRSVDVNDVSRHLVRIYHRSYSRGIFISASDYSPAAIRTCEEALSRTVVVLASLEEIVRMLNDETDLSALLKRKINAAIIEKKPFIKILD